MTVQRIKSAAFAVPVFALLAACANQGAPQSGDSVALPQRADGVENIRIVRDRRETGLPTTMYVSVDGQNVGALSRGQSISFGLEEGQYDIGLSCNVSDGRFGSQQRRRGEISVEVGQQSVEIDATSNLSCNKRPSTTHVVNRRLERYFANGDRDRDFDENGY